MTGAIAAAIVCSAALPALTAEIPAIASRQRPEKKTFTDAEITDGFFKTAFGAEYHLAGRVDRIRKYDMPVRVFADGTPCRPQGAACQSRRRHRQRGSRISTSRWPTAARAPTSRVKLVRDRDLYRTISQASTAASGPARSRPRSIRNACPASARTSSYEIEHSDVILTVDNGDFVFLDCAYEELLQSLGPINDTSTVPWTMFNDDVSMGFFDVYDQYILNLLYDPAHQGRHDGRRGQGGAARCSPDVRAWVKKVNNLPE